MPEQKKVSIVAECDATTPFQTYGGADVPSEPINITIELAPSADSEAEAIVRALRHASDVAAARFGMLAQMAGPPPAVAQVIDEMAERAYAYDGKGDGVDLLDWARRLAAAYGQKLLAAADPDPEDAAHLVTQMHGRALSGGRVLASTCRCRAAGVDPDNAPGLRCIHARPDGCHLEAGGKA